MPPSSRYKSLAIVGGVLVGLFVLALVLGLGPGRKHTSLADHLQTVGHFGFFALVAIAATLGAELIPHPVTQLRGTPYVIGLGVAVVAGSLLELAQRFVPLRMASWNDLGHDSLGAVAGIALLFAWRSRRATRLADRRLGMVAWMVLAAATVLGTWQLGTCVRDYGHRYAAYPVLLEFDRVWTDRFLWIDDEVTRLGSGLPDEWPEQTGREAVTVEFASSSSRPFLGMGVKEPYPDWRGRRAFAVDVFNLESYPVAAGVRIHDFQHNEDYYDRFNETRELQPGFQTIRIPLEEIERGPRDRRLDLSHVDGVKLFLIRPESPVRLAVGNFRLE
jgi:VanZ family protein